MPLLVLGFVFRDASSSAFCSVLATTLCIYLLVVNLVNVPVRVWVQYITGTDIPFNPSTGNVRCQYWYILVQYQYRHGTLPVLALNGARTGIGIFCTFVQYQYGYGTLPVLALNDASIGNVKEHYAK
jgi:hypothetical protein